MEVRVQTANPVAALIRAQREEIQKYKWIESERLGYDIGWERAAREWHARHHEDWKRHVLGGAAAPQAGAGAARQPLRRLLSGRHRAGLSASLRAWALRRKQLGRN